jgi:hypothetical protein
MPDDREVSSHSPQPSGQDGQDGRVVTLRPKSTRGGKARRLPVIDPRRDPTWLGEQPHLRSKGFGADDEHEDDEDGRYRTLSNIVGVALIAILIGTGVWLAHVITDQRKMEDCVLSGRRNCAPIEIPASGR